MKRSVLLFSMLLAACSPGATMDSLPEAKEVAKGFFDNFEPGKFEATHGLYSDEFWEVMPKETWSRLLPNVHSELGAIESCEIINWHQRTHAGTSGSGNFVTLSYGCKHEKYESTISFTIFKPLSGGESKIMSQNFNSIGLLLE